jgi:hypothetical protein
MLEDVSYPVRKNHAAALLQTEPAFSGASLKAPLQAAKNSDLSKLFS